MDNEKIEKLSGDMTSECSNEPQNKLDPLKTINQMRAEQGLAAVEGGDVLLIKKD